MSYPEDVLAELVSANNSLKVGVDVGETLTKIKLTTSSGVPLLTVLEPPAGWPVQVVQHHADPKTETTWKMCGKNHCPNRPRFDSLESIPREHMDEAEEQKEHSLIDTPDKLREVCVAIIEHEECGHILRRAERLERRLK